MRSLSSPNGRTAPRVDEAPSLICSEVEPTVVGQQPEPDILDGDARLRLSVAVGVYPDVEVTVEVGVPTDLTGRCEAALVVVIDEGEVVSSVIPDRGQVDDILLLPRVEVADHILIPSPSCGCSGLEDAVPVKSIRAGATKHRVGAITADDPIV